MFDYKHYVPILKTKEGEFWALQNLKDDSREYVTPLMELDKIPRPAKKKKGPTPKKPRAPRPPATLTSHLGKKCDKIVTAWGTERPLFLDTRWLSNREGDAEIITATHAAARNLELKAIPVAWTSHNESTLRAIGDAIAEDGRGVMVRITPQDLSRTHLLRAVLTTLSCKPKDVHLLIDYQSSPMNLAEDVPLVPVIDQWASFSAASGVFPASLKDNDQQEWHRIARRDFTSWSSGASIRGIKRRPAFADYTMRAPGPPAEGGNPPVVMRYAIAEHWLVRQDGYHMDGDSPEMQAICQSLIIRRDFRGPEYSAGDEAIEGIAVRSLGTGGPRQWVQYAINHHIELVVQENLT